MTTEHSAAIPPVPVNERVRDYAPGSPERASLARKLQQMSSARIELPLFIGGQEVRTNRLQNAVMPHEHVHVSQTQCFYGLRRVVTFSVVRKL